MYRGQRLNKKQQRRLKSFLARLEKAKDAHEVHARRWKEYRRVYHGTSGLAEEVCEYITSRVFIPWAWQQVETIIPRVMDTEPRMAYKPVEPGDELLAEALDTLVKVQLRQDNFVMRQRAMVEAAAVDGLCVNKVMWHQKIDTMQKRTPVEKYDEETNTVSTEDEYRTERIITENRPVLPQVNNNDFFWDPACTSDQDWRYVFHRVWMDKDEMLERERAGVWKNVKLACMEEDGSDQLSPVETEEEANARRKGKYAVYEGWFNDGTRMTVCGGVLMDDRENPHLHKKIPFVAWSTQPNPYSLVGISEIEKIAPIQEAVWIKDNQRIDSVNYALNNVTVADPTIPGIDNLEIKPKTVVPANFGQRFEQFPFDAKNAPAFQESEAYLGAMMSMTGAGPMLVNDPSVAMNMPENATGFSIMQEESHVRMAVKKLQLRLAIARMAKLVVQLNHQFLSQLELNRILGDAGVRMPRLTPYDIPMFLDVIPEAMNESVGRMTERNAAIEMLNIVGTLHGQMMNDGTVFDVKPLVEHAVKTYDLDPRLVFQLPNPALAPEPPPPMGGPPAMQEPELDQEMTGMTELM